MPSGNSPFPISLLTPNSQHTTNTRTDSLPVLHVGRGTALPHPAPPQNTEKHSAALPQCQQTGGSSAQQTAAAGSGR